MERQRMWRRVGEWVRSWRYRRRLTFVENRLATLAGALEAERRARARERETVAAALRILGAKLAQAHGRASDAEAWIGALVEVTDQNPGRGREVRRLHDERSGAMKQAPTTVTAPPAATNGATP